MGFLKLQHMFYLQVLMYLMIPLLYVQLLWNRTPTGFNSDLGIAVYGVADFSAQSTRSLAIIVLCMLFKNVFLVVTAIRSRNFGYRAAAHFDCKMFHALQFLAMAAFGELDFSHVGTLQFLGTHGLLCVLFLLATDSVDVGALKK